MQHFGRPTVNEDASSKGHAGVKGSKKAQEQNGRKERQQTTRPFLQE